MHACSCKRARKRSETWAFLAEVEEEQTVDLEEEIIEVVKDISGEGVPEHIMEQTDELAMSSGEAGLLGLEWMTRQAPPLQQSPSRLVMVELGFLGLQSTEPRQNPNPNSAIDYYFCIRDGSCGDSRVHARESRSTPDCGWRLQRELLRTDGFSPRWRVNTDTENTDGHTRFFARANTAHCCSGTGLDGNELMDLMQTQNKNCAQGEVGRTNRRRWLSSWCRGN